MTDPANSSTEFTKFHCCSEWHLSRCKSPKAVLIHSFGLHLTNGTKTFCTSALSVAEFFGFHEDTAQRAIHELAQLGFFELIEYGMFDVNVYHVLTHKEWAEKHPGQCCVKEEFVWTPENDPLGQKLYIASGARVKFKQFQVNQYKKLGLSDDELVEHLKEFRAGLGKNRKARNVPYHFLMYLKEFVLSEVPA